MMAKAEDLVATGLALLLGYAVVKAITMQSCPSCGARGQKGLRCKSCGAIV